MSNAFRSAAILLLLWTSPTLAKVKFQDVRPLLAGAPKVHGAQDLALHGGRAVVVTFFASWCPPCVQEFRHINELVDSYGGTVTIAGINLFEDLGGGKNPARMKRFLERTRPRFPLVIGGKELADAFGGVDRIPTVVVFSPSGEEVWRFIHIRDADKTHTTRDEIAAALRKAGVDAVTAHYFGRKFRGHVFSGTHNFGDYFGDNYFGSISGTLFRTLFRGHNT